MPTPPASTRPGSAANIDYNPPIANPSAYGHDRETCAARLRRVAYLRDRGLTRRQIATDIGISASTVGVYLQRAAAGTWAPVGGGVRPGTTVKPVPPETAARVAALYGSGLSIRRVGAELGMSRTAVRRVMRASGVTPRPPVRPGRETALRDRAVELYREGMSARSAGAAVGVSRSTVLAWVAAAGATRDRSDAGRLARAARDGGGAASARPATPTRR